MSSALRSNFIYILNSKKYYKLVIIAYSISTNSIIKIVNFALPSYSPPVPMASHHFDFHSYTIGHR